MLKNLLDEGQFYQFMNHSQSISLWNLIEGFGMQGMNFKPQRKHTGLSSGAAKRYEISGTQTLSVFINLEYIPWTICQKQPTIKQSFSNYNIELPLHYLA